MYANIDLLCFVFCRFQTINHILRDKTRDVYRLFLSEIEDIRTQIASHQTIDDSKVNIFDLYVPYYPGKAMWIRNLIERITKNYKFLIKSSLIDKTEIKFSYEKFLLFANNTQKRFYQEWWTIASELQPKKLLEKSFLKENNYFINVYFDPKIIIVLNESLWWIRLNYEIPYSLTDVYNTRKIFRQMREETIGFIRKYNK